MSNDPADQNSPAPQSPEPAKPDAETVDATDATGHNEASTPASANEPVAVESTVESPTPGAPTTDSVAASDVVAPASEAPADAAAPSAGTNAEADSVPEPAAAVSEPAAAAASADGDASNPIDGTTAEIAESEESDEDGPKRDVKIGSRRGDKKHQPHGARPQTPGSKPSSPSPPPQPTGPVPVPSKRGPLPEEWEKEVEDVLGGQSVEDLLAAQPSADAPASTDALEAEARVPAEVVRIHGDNVFMTLGGRNEGVASLRSFPADAQPEPGQKMEVVISSVSRDDGLYEIVVPGASVKVSDWGDLVEGAIVEAKITGTNTGGLECTVNNIRGFIPASQVSLYRVEDLSQFVEQKMTCVVTEAKEKKRNLVLSHRAVLERERAADKEKLLASLEVGQILEGIVRNIRDFGAFVDLGGVDGMIHISQMSWDRVKHPSDVVSEGETVRVRIEKIDPETNKIGLSLRSLQEHPWTGVDEKFPVGSVISGVVSRIANFGAFVKLTTGVEGLVHVSELAHHRVSLVNSVVKEGETVSVKVLTVDPDNQRISLSIKQTTEQPESHSKSKKKEEVEEVRTSTLPKHDGPLKGGVDGPSGGEQFGLKW